MKKVLLVTEHNDRFSELASRLEQSGKAEVVRARDASQAIEIAGSQKISFAVIDSDVKGMDSFELVRRLITVDVSIDTAVVSEESEEQFHEASEGLGVRFQLPSSPTGRHADLILEVIQDQIVI